LGSFFFWGNCWLTGIAGQSIGVAIGGVVFQNTFKQKLLAIPEFAPMADQYSREATAVVSIIQQMPPGDSRTELVQAYADGLRIVWMSLLAFAAVGMLLSFTIKGYSLNQEHVTEQGLIHNKPSPSRDDMESGSRSGEENEKK
jgi:hypothetical protein